MMLLLPEWLMQPGGQMEDAAGYRRKSMHKDLHHDKTSQLTSSILSKNHTLHKHDILRCSNNTNKVSIWCGIWSCQLHKSYSVKGFVWKLPWYPISDLQASFSVTGLQNVMALCLGSPWKLESAGSYWFWSECCSILTEQMGDYSINGFL